MNVFAVTKLLNYLIFLPVSLSLYLMYRGDMSPSQEYVSLETRSNFEKPRLLVDLPLLG